MAANPTVSTGRNLPPPQSLFVDPSTGILTQDGYQYLLGLINQIAQAYPTASVANGLAATGTTQATALQLSAQWNEIDTASATDNGVLLTSLQPGQSQTVFNGSAVTVNVWPVPGARIDALGGDAAFALGAGDSQTFYFTSSTQIRS